MGKLFHRNGKVKNKQDLKDAANALAVATTAANRIPREEVFPDGTHRVEVIHEVDGGTAGWHDIKPDGTINSTITPHI